MPERGHMSLILKIIIIQNMSIKKVTTLEKFSKVYQQLLITDLARYSHLRKCLTDIAQNIRRKLTILYTNTIQNTVQTLRKINPK